MGNNPTMCCADHTGCERVDMLHSSSFEAHNKGKQRLLRRVIETLRPSRPPSKFFKDKFASSNLEIKPVVGKKVANDTNEDQTEGSKRMDSLYRDETPADSQSQYLPATYAMSSDPPLPERQVRTFSSMSTFSEIDDRDTRSERVTRRTSFCSSREGVEEEERRQLEPEGHIGLAVE